MLGTENLKATRIKVVTERSVVYLMGLVSRQEADLATEDARSVSGVKRVVRLFEYTD
jgi:osmotically-inducible protein OsmY